MRAHGVTQRRGLSLARQGVPVPVSLEPASASRRRVYEPLGERMMRQSVLATITLLLLMSGPTFAQVPEEYVSRSDYFSISFPTPPTI